MKKLLSLLILLLSFSSFAANSMDEYTKTYPFSNPFDATILGSSILMVEGVSDKAQAKDYSIPAQEKNIPEIFWKQKEFRFSLIKQKHKADLVFLLAGTGSSYDSLRMKYLQKILYDAGFHVLSISSQMTVNFLVAASSTHVPGILKEDAKDMYRVMKEAYQKVEKEVEVNKFLLTGYSLGATNAAFLSELDEREKVFQFERVYMINPAVDLYDSSRKLDTYLDSVTGVQGKYLGVFLDNIVSKIRSKTSEYGEFTREELFKYFQSKEFTDEQKAALVGLAFRINALDLNLVADVFAKTCNYVPVDMKWTKFSSMMAYFEKLHFSNFESYMANIAVPYYTKKMQGIPEETLKEQLIAQANLREIKEYLKQAKKVVVVTNEDELILDEEDHKFLREIFQDRLFVYPKGGHCGNMFFTPNVLRMTGYLKGGIWNEK